MPIPDWRQLRYQLDQRQKGFEVSPEVEQRASAYDNLSEEEWDNILKDIEVRNSLKGEARHALLQQGNIEHAQEMRDLANLEGDTGYGDYRKDTNIPFEDWIQNPTDYRANAQTAAAKIANGVIKGGITAATTFADNTIGLLTGVLNVGLDAVNGDGQFRLRDSFINNKFSRDLQGVREEAEEVLPNYRTQEELDDANEWWKHLNANFFGDVLLKNIGFTVGAGLSGGLYAGLTRNALKRAVVSKASKLAGLSAVEGNAVGGNLEGVVKDALLANPKAGIKILERAERQINRIPIAGNIAGGLFGAAGEARVEAMEAAKEFRDPAIEAARYKYEAEKQALDEEFNNPFNNHLTKEPIYDGYGKVIDYNYVIAGDDKDEYNKRLLDIQKDYEEESNKINEQAWKVGVRTFGWNMPLLTISDMIMFGRMFKGGYKTQSRFKVRGNPEAGYTGVGSTARTIGKGLYKSATEGLEELSQKIISESAKDISDNNLAAFNNAKYDENGIKDTAEWMMDVTDDISQAGQVGQTIARTLKDPSAWEEFAIGAFTGALSHAVTGGIKADIKEQKENQAAAEALNKRVSDPLYQTLWSGIIRHNTYEQQKEEALNSDNSFAWHSANDKQMLSDIMMFADAGRLNDLEKMIKSFANVAPEDIEDLDLIDDSDPEFNDKTPEQKAEWISKRGKEVLNTIDRYRKIKESLDFPAFNVDMGTDAMNELIYTQSSLMTMADRYSSVLKGVLSKVRPVLEANSGDSKADGETTAQANSARGLLADIPEVERAFLGYSENTPKELGTSPAVYMLDSENLANVHTVLDRLANAVDDPEVKNDVKDLHKLINTGKVFYERIYSDEFRKTFADEYEKLAKTREEEARKLKEQAENKKVKKYQKSLDEKTGGVNTIEQMNVEYAKAEDKPTFIKAMEEKAKNDKQAEEFVKIRKSYNDFRNALISDYPDTVNKSTGGFSHTGEVMLDRIVNQAKSESDFVSNSDKYIPSYEDVRTELDRMADAGLVTDDEIFDLTVRDQYNKMTEAIKNTAESFRNAWNSTSGRETLVENHEKTESKPTVDDDAAPVPAASPVTVYAPNAETAEEFGRAGQDEKAEIAKEAEETPYEEDNSPEPVFTPETEEIVADTLSTFEDNIDEDKTLVSGITGAVRGHYQQSIPEMALSVISYIRDLISRRKNVKKEEMEAIDAALNSADYSNFVVFDDEGNVIGGEKDYAESYKWLQDNKAFEYTSSDLKTGDEVVFAILPDAPLSPEGQKQIIVGVVKEKKNGEVTSIQPITMLHSMDKANEYLNLNDLYDAILQDYESSEPDALYIFGGKKTPKTSKVFAKRPGIVRYGTEKKNVKQIPGYRDNAPIMVMDKSNRPVVVRGNVDPSKLHTPNIYEWSSPHNGRVYYMADNGNGTYTPIYLDKVPITSEMVMQNNGNKFLQYINDTLNDIDNLTHTVTKDNVEQKNHELSGKIGKLIDHINLDGILFNYTVDSNGNPSLNVTWGDSNAETVSLGKESVFQVLNMINRPARISYNPKWVKATRNNLADIIDAGLLQSDARELRQVGTNFWYDPWNPNEGRFERVLTEFSTPEEVKTPPSKPEPQQIAKASDIKPVEDTAKKPTEPPVKENPVDKEDVKSFDEVLSNATPEYELDYEDLSEESKKELESKGISQERWDEADDDYKRHWLNC